MISPLTATELAAQLVQIPSVNPMGRAVPPGIAGESRVTDWLQDFFSIFDVPFRRYAVRQDSLEDEVMLRENILARFDGQPGLEEGGALVMLEAHQDTVPVDGMTIDPFGGHVAEERLHGRGSCDIKGGLASLLAATGQLFHSDEPRPTIVVACTINEEFGFCGAKHLAALINGGGDDIIQRVPDAIIVTEPTQLNIATCHKGMVRWVCETTGTAAHSSQPKTGSNAIYRMAPVLSAIDALADRIGQRDADAMMGNPTLSVGTIQGGVSVNTVPDQCRIEIDRRLLPSEDQDAARSEVIKATLVDSNDQHILHHDAFISSPGLTAGTNNELAAQLTNVAARYQPDSRVIGVPYGTDAAFLAKCGAPTVVFGPGSIEQAHTKNEWVSTRELESSVAILTEFLRLFATTT